MYRVILDGTDILSFDKPNHALLNPVLTMELNTAGSFEFTIPQGHPLYEDDDDVPLGLRYFWGPVHPLNSTIEVCEDNDLLWWGRPIEVKLDFWNQKQVYCEGALAFFNDSIQRFHEYDSVSLHSFFQAVIAAHNSQVAESRQFTVGDITVTDKNVYRKLNYESTFDVLKRMCLDAEGGYLRLRRENGVNYIDWLANIQYADNQSIEFGLNMLDAAANFDGSDIVTCIVPYGSKDNETGEPLTIASVNNGSDTIESWAVSRYGRITKAVSFSGIDSAYELLQAALEYMNDLLFDNFSIECSAADLHGLDNLDIPYNSFRLGQLVLCRSEPHLLNRQFPITKISVRLDTAAKQITLGTSPKRTLTRIQKEERDKGQPDEEPVDDGTGGISYVVTGISIDSPPTKRFYEPGETLDFTGLKVVAICSDNTARDITSVCVFSPTEDGIVSNVGTLTVSVQYVWSETTFSDSFDLTVRVPVITILVDHYPDKTRYNVGEALDFTGLIIKAETQGGDMPDITQECEYSPEDGSTPSKYGNILIDVWYQGQFFPSVFSMLVVPSETGTFTVTFVNGNTVLQVVNDVPYQGVASYTGPTPTPSEAQFGMSFAGWNPYPSYVTSDMVCYAQFRANLIAADEITDSWSEIIANHGANYAVGSYKSLSISGYNTVRMQKVAAGEGGTTSTWVAMDSLTNHWMYPYDWTDGGWAASEMRSWLNTTVLNALPVFIREGISPVTKYSRSYSYSNKIYYPNSETIDTLWIPSMLEVYGETSDYESLGIRFSGPDLSTAIPDGYGSSNTTSWWLRSVWNGTAYCLAPSSGPGSNYFRANYAYGVRLGFCL